jgi:methylmalonyl-CoA mutase cobalamin-binding subunit
VLAANDWRVLFLGGDTPLADVESCVQQVQVKAVFFSVALGAPRSDTRWVLTALRARLPAEVDLVVGGMGAPADIAGLQYIASLQDLDRRLAEAGRN